MKTEITNRSNEVSEFPKTGCLFWYIDIHGFIEAKIWRDHFSQREQLNYGNVYKTEKEAKRWRDHFEYIRKNNIILESK